MIEPTVRYEVKLQGGPSAGTLKKGVFGGEGERSEGGIGGAIGNVLGG